MKDADSETKIEIIEMCDWCLSIIRRDPKKPIKAEVMIQKSPNGPLFFHHKCLKEILSLIDKELLKD